MEDAFMVTTYRDAEALRRPTLAPRDKRTYGPFKSYDEAVRFGTEQCPDISHFKVDRLYVHPLVDMVYVEVPTLTHPEKKPG